MRLQKDSHCCFRLRLQRMSRPYFVFPVEHRLVSRYFDFAESRQRTSKTKSKSKIRFFWRIKLSHFYLHFLGQGSRRFDKLFLTPCNLETYFNAMAKQEHLQNCLHLWRLRKCHAMRHDNPLFKPFYSMCMEVIGTHDNLDPSHRMSHKKKCRFPSWQLVLHIIL